MIRYGNYVLLEKIAEGGMAEIFLAKQVGAEGFERTVVIKRMLESLTRSAEFVNMFLDEARLAAKLQHPNIVQITDLGQVDGSYFICMEYLAGLDLETIIRGCQVSGRVMPLGPAFRIALSVLEGLEFAHGFVDAGTPLHLVHRDVTPSNIFVTFQGSVRLLDFGIARAQTRAVKTQTGMVKGKWSYMSPEQALGAEIDARTDLFAFGLTIYELLTGRRVFDKNHEMAIMQAVLTEPIPKVRTLRPDVPPAVEAVLHRALERDLSLRAPSAAQLRLELEQAIATAPQPGSGPRELAKLVADIAGAQEVERRSKVPSISEFMNTPALAKTAVGSNPLGPAAGGPIQLGAPLRAQEPPPVQSAHFSEAATINDPRIKQTTQLVKEKSSSRAGALIALAVFAAAGGAGGAVYLTRSEPPGPQRFEPIVTAPPELPPIPDKVDLVEPTAPLKDPEPTPDVVPAAATTTTTTKTEDEERAPRRITKLQNKEIVQAFSGVGGKIRGCFEQNRSLFDGQTGKVRVRVTIDPSGKVSEAGVTNEGMTQGPFATCMKNVLTAVKLRKHTEAVTVTLPFAYREDLGSP